MSRKATFPLIALAAVLAIVIRFDLFTGRAAAQEEEAPRSQPSLTIYNQNFAVVRDSLKLTLKPGTNRITYTGATAHLEPESVLLRDPSGARLQILEQNYRADPISQELLLSMSEGQTIEFEIQRDGKPVIVTGKLIRAGYVPHPAAWRRYGQQYYQAQMAMTGGYGNPGNSQPIVEMDGRLHFGLPGRPIFPSLGQDTILKPTLDWVLRSDRSGEVNSELSYVTGGFSWEADYNVVAPPEGDVVEIAGWVTLDNQSGKTFDNAKVKLMAGDVAKLQPGAVVGAKMARSEVAADAMQPPVSEKAFDEYHLYSLHRPVTLRDRQTKQVEFIRAPSVKADRLYVYDGARIDYNRYRGYSPENILQDAQYGTVSNPKVWSMIEFVTSKRNGLGVPLPKGRLRFYRRDADGLLQFTGENVIPHTPVDETVRVYTGNAFDLAAERRRTDYKVDSSARWVDESFEIKLRNHKKQTVEIRVVEHLYRWHNWQIAAKNRPFRKMDSQTIEFRVSVPPQTEQIVNYTVHYTW